MKAGKQIIARYIFSPLAFIVGLCILGGGTIIAIFPMATLIGIAMCSAYPLVWIMQSCGIKLGWDYEFKDCFMLATVYAWFPFYCAKRFITDGNFSFIDD